MFTFNSAGREYTQLFAFTQLDVLGAQPQGRLLVDQDDLLYGTTTLGGASNEGTIYRMKPDGSDYKVLHSFIAGLGDGIYPSAGLTLGSDGWLYGSTTVAGPKSKGCVFRMRKDGSGHTNICVETASSILLLTQADDGRLYGGGQLDNGIFSLQPDGSDYHVLRSIDGFLSSLTLGSDGRLYGSSASGGTNGAGFAFRLGRDGSDYATIRDYPGTPDWNGNAPNSLMEGSDHALYGVSHAGGSVNAGMVFRMNRDGSEFAVLRSFGQSSSDGTHPSASLLQRADGTLWGTCDEGGLDGIGTVFALNPDGSGYRVIRSFDLSQEDVNGARSPLVAGKFGLYGTTYQPYHYGVAIFGTAYRLSRAASLDEVYLVGILPVDDQQVRLRGSAIPGMKLEIQAKADLTIGSWTGVTRLSADDSGQFQLTDAILGRAALFWRAVPVVE